MVKVDFEKNIEEVKGELSSLLSKLQGTKWSIEQYKVEIISRVEKGEATRDVRDKIEDSNTLVGILENKIENKKVDLKDLEEKLFLQNKEIFTKQYNDFIKEKENTDNKIEKQFADLVDKLIKNTIEPFKLKSQKLEEQLKKYGIEYKEDHLILNWRGYVVTQTLEVDIFNLTELTGEQLEQKKKAHEESLREITLEREKIAEEKAIKDAEIQQKIQ